MRNLGRLNAAEPNHYTVLGLARDCTRAEIRNAYRSLAKRHHPDLNQNSVDARRRTQALNSAYEILSDPGRRRAYDRELEGASRSAAPGRGSKIERNVRQDVVLRIEDVLRGTTLEVHVKDPANADGPEVYQLRVPPGTAPGARFRLPRSASPDGGFVELRVKVLPGFRFKLRGSDLRCDLRIDNRRARDGGSETLQGPTGTVLRLQIPAGVKRGEILRIPGEGLPKPRGGRGDLLVRIVYRPEVSVSRSR